MWQACCLPPLQCMTGRSKGPHKLPAVKGALDGGLDIPHSEKRFVGYSADDKSLDAEVLRKHIYGGHVAEYMEEMQEEAPEKYQVDILT